MLLARIWNAFSSTWCAERWRRNARFSSAFEVPSRRTSDRSVTTAPKIIVLNRDRQSPNEGEGVQLNQSYVNHRTITPMPLVRFDVPFEHPDRIAMRPAAT